MSVTAEDIQRMAKLAKLKIMENNILQYQQHLNNLLKLAEKISDVDTGLTGRMSHPFENQHQCLRPDIPTEQDQRELLQSIAPNVIQYLYILPKVLE